MCSRSSTCFPTLPSPLGVEFFTLWFSILVFPGGFSSRTHCVRPGYSRKVKPPFRLSTPSEGIPISDLRGYDWPWLPRLTTAYASLPRPQTSKPLFRVLVAALVVYGGQGINSSAGSDGSTSSRRFYWFSQFCWFYWFSAVVLVLRVLLVLLVLMVLLVLLVLGGSTGSHSSAGSTGSRRLYWFSEFCWFYWF